MHGVVCLCVHILIHAGIFQMGINKYVCMCLNVGCPRKAFMCVGFPCVHMHVYGHNHSQGELYRLLALCVQTAGHLIQDKDLWLSDQSPGDGNALLLAAREQTSSLSYI